MCFQVTLKVSGGLLVGKRNIRFDRPRHIRVGRRDGSCIMVFQPFAEILCKSGVEMIGEGLAFENVDAVPH